MPAMSSTVMTGRRTNNSERFTARALGLEPYLGTRSELQLSPGDDLLSAFDARGNDGFVAFDSIRLDFAHLGGHVRLHHEHVFAVGPILDRPGRDQDSIAL